MRRKSSSYNERDDDGELINLTPLLDVLFVILIMFMLIAPLMEIDRIALAPGNHLDKHHPALTPSSHIKIYIQRDNTIWIGNEKIPYESLSLKLSSLKLQFPSDKPQLFLDDGAHFGLYQRIKNCMENLQFESLDIFLKSDDDK